MKISKSLAFKVKFAQYEMLEFFASAEDEAQEGEEEKVGARLHEFCRNQIEKDYRHSFKYMAMLAAKEEKEKLLETEI